MNDNDSDSERPRDTSSTSENNSGEEEDDVLDDPNQNKRINRYYRDGCDPDGLYLPFAAYVAPIEGSSEGHRLPNSDPPLLKLEGDWLVEETTNKGYPAVLRTEDRDAAVAAVLDVPNKKATYTSALIGYTPDIGSFTMAVVGTRSEVGDTFTTKIPFYADCCDFERLEGVLTNSTNQTPVGIVRDRNISTKQQSPCYDHYSKTYIWYNTAEHNPWNALDRTKLSSYLSLINRYKTAADEIMKPFNESRNSSQTDSIGDPQSGAELQKLAQDMFSTDDQ